jgi:CubicO group peptidase (beta-lactamase class C family)
MAKFGYLYLNNGSWNGEQIIPSEWVQTSSETLTYFNDNAGYSYQWWTYLSEDVDVYGAEGYQGQSIYVVPSLDIVVVFTSSFPPYEPYPHTAILFDYIIPAAINEVSQRDQKISLVTVSTIFVLPLPALAAAVFYRIRTRS